MGTGEKNISLLAKLAEIDGEIKRICDTVFGNGLPGHEKRIKVLEDAWASRRETCPIAKDQASRRNQTIIIIGLLLNAAMTAAEFIRG